MAKIKHVCSQKEVFHENSTIKYNNNSGELM